VLETSPKFTFGGAMEHGLDLGSKRSTHPKMPSCPVTGPEKPLAMYDSAQTQRTGGHKLIFLALICRRAKNEMNIAMWILAGGILGWLGFPFIMRANAKRGSVILMVIGAVGGVCGGTVLAPMLGPVSSTPNVFSLFSLGIALGSAGGCLIIWELVSSRYSA